MRGGRPFSRVLASMLALLVVGAVVGGLISALAVGLSGNGSQALAQDAATWYVDDDGLDCPDADFARIQDAMGASSYGDTIIVCPGNYHYVDAVIEAGREVIIQAGAVWRVRSLVLREWAHWIHRGIFYWQAGYSIDLSAEGASISIEGGHGYKDYSPFLIVEEAQTSKDIYIAHESVQITGLVTDQNGTEASATVVAEITKPGGSVETLSLVETEPGTYEGTFSVTSSAGSYRVAIRAELNGYTGHAAWTGFEVDDSGSLPAENGTVCVETATGTGIACFTPSYGTIVDLAAIVAYSLPSVSFPHGMFSFVIADLTPEQRMTLTIELPDPVAVGTVWWKYDNGRWHSLANLNDNGDNIMVIQLTDGGTGDLDSIAGQITDPGGPGNPMTVGWEGSPTSKAAVLWPWIAMVAAAAGAGLLRMRRRRSLN